MDIDHFQSVATESAATPSGWPEERARLPASIAAMPIGAIRTGMSIGEVFRRLASSGSAPLLDKQKQPTAMIYSRDLLGFPPDLKRFPLLSDQQHRWTPTLQPSDPAAIALTRFSETDAPYIPLVDGKRRYTGECVSRSRLLALLSGELRPLRAGGLATPLGVYMTSGRHMAGSGVAGLIATGMLFGLMLPAMDWLWMVFYSALIAIQPALLRLDPGNVLVLENGFMLVTLLTLLRLSPMAGLHAAEHMTINALESNLPISPETVRLQPREHLRCGTNLMVLLSGIMLLSMCLLLFAGVISPTGLLIYAAFWAWLIFNFWRPAGLWLQRHFTTKPPTMPQLESGLRAGRELLTKFENSPHPLPGLPQRLWSSGLPIMLASFSLTAWLFSLLLDVWVK